MNTPLIVSIAIATSITNAFGMISKFIRPLVTTAPRAVFRGFNVPQIGYYKPQMHIPYYTPTLTPKKAPTITAKPMSKYFALAMAMEENNTTQMDELQKKLHKKNLEEPVITRNMQKAIVLFHEKGLAEAQYLLGFCLLRGIGIKENIKEGLALLKKAADAGLAKAMYELGFCFLRGIKINKNENVGIEWLNRAIEQGNTNAMYELGCYLHHRRTTGQQRKTDNEDARKLLLLAAQNGYAGAEDELERWKREGA